MDVILRRIARAESAPAGASVRRMARSVHHPPARVLQKDAVPLATPRGVQFSNNPRWDVQCAQRTPILIGRVPPLLAAGGQHRGS